MYVYDMYMISDVSRVFWGIPNPAGGFGATVMSLEAPMI